MPVNWSNPQEVTQFRNAALQQGFDPTEVDQAIADNVANTVIAEPTPQQPKSVQGFIGNVGKSALNTVGGIGSSLINVFNPNMEQNTVANIAKTGLGAIELALPGEQGHEKYIKAVGQSLKDRYGSAEAIGNTLYSDPVGAALDVSTVLGGVGGLAKGVGSAAKLGKLARAGEAAAAVGEAINPLSVAGKVIGKPIQKVFDKTGEITKTVGKEASLAPLKATASQKTRFLEDTGSKLDDFTTQHGLYGNGEVAAAKAEKIIQPLQEQYNSLVRTGTTISGEQYAQALQQRALDIISKDRSPAARALAEKLWTEGFEQAKLGDITDTVLTNSKTSSFNKVSRGALADQLSVNVNKEMGNVARNLLDEVAPGSADIGKKLKDFRTFQDIALDNAEKGSGLIGSINANAAGIAGTAMGSMVGNPILGAAAGYGAAAVAQNPKFLELVGRGTAAAGNTLPKVPPLLGGAARAAAYPSRLVTPPDLSQDHADNGNQGPEEYGSHTNLSGSANYSEPNNNYGPSVSGLSTGRSSLPSTPPESTQYVNEWGKSPYELLRAAQKAQAAGDVRSAKILRQAYEDEIAYAKATAAAKPKPKSSAGLQIEGKAKSGLQAADLIESILMKNPNMALESSVPMFDLLKSQDRKLYESAVSSITDAIGGLRTGASVSKEQQEFYRNMLPKAGDDPATVRQKLETIRSELGGYVGIDVVDSLPTNPSDVAF